jgi:PAS domain S-box-containing protein
MRPPLQPTNEARRLDALRQYRVLDTQPERALDDLAALAADICAAPISLISLVDQDRQWFKSKVGWNIAETPRHVSFCGHVIAAGELLIVPDAAADVRFADNPLVTGDPHIRFYAGAPLVTPEGEALGTLCVIDCVPRHLTTPQQDALLVLSRQVMSQLALRRQTRELAESEARFRLVTDNARAGIVLVNLERRYAYANRAYAEIFGLPSPAIIGARIADVQGDSYEEQIRGQLDRAFAGERVTGEFHKPAGNRYSHYSVTYEPTTRDGSPALVVIVLTDITERKTAEELVRIGTERFRIVVQATNDAVWDWNLATDAVSWNEGYQGLFGYLPEDTDPTVASWTRFIHPDDLSRVIDRIDEVIARGGRWSDEYRFRRHDGTYAQVFDRGQVIHDERGRAVRMVGAMQDVTERRQAEEALRGSEARYRTLFECAPDGILIADTSSVYIDANPSMCRMLGYSRDELVGLHASNIVTPEEIEHIVPALRRITGASEYRREWHFRRKDGSTFAADVFATSMPDGRLLAMIRDVTERNEASEARRTAEERMRFALESAEVGIWDMDYSTGVLRWSEILEAQYGLAPRTFGGTFAEFVERTHPDDRAALLETVGNATKAGSDFSINQRSVWPDGTVRWLSGAGRIHLDDRGEPVRGVGVLLDVTERRTLEEQFQQAQKMEAIGRLAGGVAHDFNNLLTVILGYCELLLQDLDPADLRQADIAEIEKAGLRGAGLTRQLLAFSRKEIIEPAQLDLNAILSDMLTMLGRLIGEDIKVVVRPSPGVASVNADRGQVEQIVMNLAVNARDAMPDGGTLTIETGIADLGDQYARTHLDVAVGRYVALTVTDTGTGMKPDVQARLFEPFFTTKEAGKGTGLGLATVQGIAMRSGGSVAFHSELDKGTSFTVYFPQADVAEIVTQVAPPARPRTGSQTVLVVEDADGLRELARRLLERQGYTVLVAANAEEALRLFESEAAIDVLLTDVVMPGGSGPELTRRVVEGRPTLKVIYMSGYTEDAIVHHGVLNPGIDFLHKPFTSETLGRKVREVLER